MPGSVLSLCYSTDSGRFIGKLIESSQLAAESVISSKLASGVIGFHHISPLSVGSGKIGWNSLLSGKYAAGSIRTPDIGDLQVGSGKVGWNSLLSGKLGPLAVNAPNINWAALVSGKLASGSVLPDNIHFLAGMLSRPTPPGCVLDLDFSEGAGIGANDVDDIKARTKVYDKSGENNDGTLYVTPVELSTCDATTDWTGESLSTETTIKVEGTGSVKDTIAAPTSSTDYVTFYNPAAVINLSSPRKHLIFWLRSDRASTAFTFTRIYMFDNSLNYRSWDITFDADTWKKQKLLLSTGTGSDQSATPPDLSAINHIHVYFRTADTTAFVKYIDYLVADDRPVFEDGNFGKALSFDGENDYVDAGNDASLDITDAITVEVWVKINSWVNNGGIVTKRTVNTPGDWEFRLSSVSGELTWGIYTAGGAWISYSSSDADLATDTWYHLVLITDGTDVLMYRSGTSLTVGAGGTPLTSQSSSLKIGKGYVANFNGLIDEVRIYNRVLSLDEIRGRYIQGLTRLGKLQGSLRLFTSGWDEKIRIDPETADFRAISGGVRTSGRYYAGSLQVPITDSFGYLASNAVSGGLPYPWIRSGYQGARVGSGYAAPGLTGFLPFDRISGLPYANLALSGKIQGVDILSGYPLGYRLGSGYGASGLTGLVPYASVSGFLPLAGGTLTGNLDIQKNLPMIGLFGTETSGMSVYMFESAGKVGLLEQSLGQFWRVNAITEELEVGVVPTARLTGFLPFARISGLPYANLALSGKIQGLDILSGYPLGYRLGSGYAAPGLTGLVPYARISGFLPLAGGTLTGNLDIQKSIPLIGLLGTETSGRSVDVFENEGRAGFSERDVGYFWSVNVVTKELEVGVVPSARLKTGTGYVVVSGWSSLSISMHEYSFSPSVTSQSLSGKIYMRPVETEDPGDTIPQFHLDGGPNVVSFGASVRWRYCTATGPPEIWLGIRSGKIAAVWEADDPAPEAPPIYSDEFESYAKIIPDSKVRELLNVSGFLAEIIMRRATIDIDKGEMGLLGATFGIAQKLNRVDVIRKREQDAVRIKEIKNDMIANLSILSGWNVNRTRR